MDMNPDPVDKTARSGPQVCSSKPTELLQKHEPYSVLTETLNKTLLCNII